MVFYVQNFDDSQGSAIHIMYRNLLRSSSSSEPSRPPVMVYSLVLKLSENFRFQKFVKSLVLILWN